MTGLQKVCKLYGTLIVINKDGKEITWLWDYKQDKPRLKSEMTREEILDSEKYKWESFGKQASIV